jgi:hypothetical protein
MATALTVASRAPTCAKAQARARAVKHARGAIAGCASVHDLTGRLRIDDASFDTVAVRWRAAMAELIDAYGVQRRPSSDLDAHRRFNWFDVLVNSIYAGGLNWLSQLVLKAVMATV